MGQSRRGLAVVRCFKTRLAPRPPAHLLSVNMHPSKTNLSTLTPAEITRIYHEQCKEQRWSFSNEREHMENLFCQRLNFLLIVYSLIVAGLVATNARSLFIGILLAGTAITFLMGLSLWRACSKLLVMFAICYRIENHPIELVDRETATRSMLYQGFRVNHMLGYWIPAFCTLTLVAALVFVWLGKLGPTS